MFPRRRSDGRCWARHAKLKISMPSQNSFGSAGELRVGDRSYRIYRLAALEKAGLAKLSRIPYSIKILLENLLRFEDGSTVKRSDIEYVAAWDTKAAAR